MKDYKLLITTVVDSSVHTLTVSFQTYEQAEVAIAEIKKSRDRCHKVDQRATRLYDPLEIREN